MRDRRAQYLFKVSEYSPEVREGAQEGTLRIAPVPFISTEHRGGCEGFEAPLENGGFAFDLHKGTSMEEAKKIAEFLNRNLESVGTLTFGDAEDVAVEVENSEREQRIAKDGFSDALTTLKDNLGVNNLQGAIATVEAIEGWANSLLRDWTRTIERFR